MKIDTFGWDQPQCRMLELGAGLSGVSYSATLKTRVERCGKSATFVVD
ncbi:MAG TPA: hypothetical protein VM578_07300 [Candidatus Saccharimonadales bacterium]|nr:hypothetical protein [Candidatus Saccharimonadales bacterium]